MEYHAITAGQFLSRPNRFIANIAVGGETVVCHVKNTGRCRELLIPGATVYLEHSDHPARKTKFDLVAVEKGDLLINMDAQAPNRLFYEWAAAGKFCPDLLEIRPEVSYGASRLDFRLETREGPFFVEVKGVTLEEDGVARFPDAPTERGVKHLRELIRAVESGARAAVFFVIQMKGVTSFRPNDRTHPAFGEALRAAAAAVVEVYAYDCAVTTEKVCIDAPVPVRLQREA